MNYRITPTSHYAPLIPALTALVDARGGDSTEQEFELQDTVLRCAGRAWDIGTKADALNAQAAQIDADRKAAEEQAAEDAKNAPPPVPFSVTPYQMRRALNQSGMRDAVESAVADSDTDTKDAWEYAIEIRRDNELLSGMAIALGLTDEQLDDLFRLAASFQ